MDTKQKNRDPESPRENRRSPRPQGEPEGRKRPEGRPAPAGERRPRPEGDRRPAPEGERRPRPEGDRRPRPEGERRPRPEGDRRPRPEGERRPRSEGDRRPAPEGERRPRPEGEKGERRPAPAGERRPRPEGDRRPADRRPGGKPAQKRPDPRKAGKKAPKSEPPRGYAKPSFLDRFRNKKPSKLQEEPQGTEYQRSTPRATGLQELLRKNKKEPTSGRPSQAVARKTARAEQAEHKRRQALRFDTPAVVYTEPKPFNRSRLVVQLMSVLAVAVAFVMALSIFFKVEVITVAGADTYSAYAIREASGIQEGDNLLTFSRARACGQIQANLPYVDKVRIGIKLPNTVNIEIEELDVAYSIMADTGDWWLMTSEGRVVDQINAAASDNYTKVLGVTLDTPIIGEQGRAVELPPQETLAEGETAPVIISGAQRLNAALEILIALEDNDIVGDAASVDVSSLEQIELWYGKRYQVNLGDNTRLDFKIACMYDVILQMSDYQTGMLDISFKTISDQVVYTPFS